MKDLALRLLKIYPDLDLRDTVRVQDDSDGRGPYIAVWNDPRPQPSLEQLAAVVL